MNLRDWQKLLFSLSIGIAIILLLYPLHPAYCAATGFFVALILSNAVDKIDNRKNKKNDYNEN